MSGPVRVGVGLGVALAEAEGVDAGRVSVGVGEAVGVGESAGALSLGTAEADEAGPPDVGSTVAAVPAAQPARSAPAESSGRTALAARRAGVGDGGVFTRRHAASASRRSRRTRRTSPKCPGAPIMSARFLVTGTG
ncbi:hypothetical protein CELD12_23520 [Cellulomonas sp. NTE-D12]|nr:hypothetical protein CELD12_23520 [Cellulomonas sp. NTE-D12]